MLGFESVYERLDATLRAGGHAARDGVGGDLGGGAGGAGSLGWGAGHQTLLIAQLRKMRMGEGGGRGHVEGIGRKGGRGRDFIRRKDGR